MIRMNEKGLTLFEVLISISVGSIVILMLLSVTSSVLGTRNAIEYDNRLLDESYHIAETIQQAVFELGVRSVEYVATDVEGKDIIRLSHEYDLAQRDDGSIFRDYSNRRSYILLYDSETMSLYYGPETEGTWDSESLMFIDPDQYRLNASNIEVTEGSFVQYTCFDTALFEDEEERCYSAIITLNITLTQRLRSGERVFSPKAFQTTIIF